MSAAGRGGRIPILYLAPWVDIGGTDGGTIDWFRWLDRSRFAPSIITTQESPNRRLHELLPFAEEVWPLPELMPGEDFAAFILSFIASRGVRLVHVMNSRLGYDLLPDIRALPDPPSVVVQLHVEEPNRTGFVSYVTTRYGNLVDTFSVIGEHVADAVRAYEVPGDRCRVIHLGVDADEVFNPERVEPVKDLERGPFHLVYPARLVYQKDPLLMVEVASALKNRNLDFRIHVLGDGLLEERTRASIAEHGVEREVLLHGSTTDMPSWYAAADLVLMTSLYEGLSCVVYEAMAMGVPIIAPALPGNRELMGGEGGRLIEPRDDVEAYAASIEELLADAPGRRSIGARSRAHVLRHFRVSEMTLAHERLYEELLATRPALHVLPPPQLPAPQPPAMRFTRPSRGQPLVSIIIPCLDQGHFLVECLHSINQQTYPALQLIVIDDGSQDSFTTELLARLDREREVRVIRQGRRTGPARARNAGIDQAKGRYILPVDADNLLLPDAVERLVEQLQGAGEGVGFIYPNQAFFGNRQDYFEAPDYNLHTLLWRNYCDTCSLFDADIFAAGIRFADDIGLGHEDWDLVLQLASRGIQGRPATTRTLLTRKWGFTRSDEVDFGRDDFAAQVRERHPELFGDETRVKARWAPALSVIALEPVVAEGEAEALLAMAEAQTCLDAELVVRTGVLAARPGEGIAVRRIPPALALSPRDALVDGLAAARGRFLVLTRGTGAELLQDPTFVEKMVRRFDRNPVPAPMALVEGGEGSYPFQPAAQSAAKGAPFAVAWAVSEVAAMPDVILGRGQDVAEVARVLGGTVGVENHLARGPSDPTPSGERDGYVGVALAGTHTLRPAAVAERALRRVAPPVVPAAPPGSVRRLEPGGSWRPPMTIPLCRHLQPETGNRVVTNHRDSPPGYVLEFEIGSINIFPLRGTTQLISSPGPVYRAAAPDQAVLADELHLGYLELGDYPMLDRVDMGLNPYNAQQVLLGGDDDPARSFIRSMSILGWIEPYPLRPRRRVETGTPGEVLTVLAAREEDMQARRDAALMEGARQAEELRERLDRITGSLPFRAYLRVKRVPGMRSVLLWRPRRRGQ
ncbi:MAG TPA: glycosyltransferase [Candidatus Dormibacteraeota bacterium]